MRYRPSNHYKAWTAEDVSELKRLLDQGTPLLMVAMALGRSQKAVAARVKFGKALAKQDKLYAAADNAENE